MPPATQPYVPFLPDQVMNYSSPLAGQVVYTLKALREGAPGCWKVSQLVGVSGLQDEEGKQNQKAAYRLLIKILNLMGAAPKVTHVLRVIHILP